MADRNMEDRPYSTCSACGSTDPQLTDSGLRCSDCGKPWEHDEDVQVPPSRLPGREEGVSEWDELKVVLRDKTAAIEAGEYEKAAHLRDRERGLADDLYAREVSAAEGRCRRP